jgi:type II secretory pathway pseudopilin PulG
MKMILVVCAMFLLSAGSFAQSTPAARVQQARTAQELLAMSAEERAMLEFRAEKLCWFEQVKPGANASYFTLTDRNGNAVELTDAMVADFNPLLFNLPQQAVSCENLPVQTTSGNQYLLIVRSEQMMSNEWQRLQIQRSKKQSK